jgi:hypothetical protein
MTIVGVWPNKMIENRELHGFTVKRHTYPIQNEKRERVIWYRDKKTNLQLWEKTNNKLFVMFLTQWNVKVWQKTTCTNQSVLPF